MLGSFNTLGIMFSDKSNRFYEQVTTIFSQPRKSVEATDDRVDELPETGVLDAGSKE